ncbi:hypothetical protein MMA231_01253 [Asticcacaulis sp. MM231]|uniref:DNA cytosine methyltransferase n=1 Tax=Asticcacaulis sp. MM231 TaxID=3157666 RepID=UPI0032D58A10
MFDNLDRPGNIACDAPTFVDIFAGCGGLSLGLKRAGWRGLFAIEKDAFAFQTMSSNFPDNAGWRSYDWPESIERKPWDINELLTQKKDALDELSQRVDLLAGGPPCQGFSHAGRRRPEDPRNRLFEAYLDLVGIIKPKIVLIENVLGFTSDFNNIKEGNIKNFAQALIDALSTDYNTVFSIIRASEYGVPQNRMRFFLIGVRKECDLGGNLDVFFQKLEKEAGGFLASRGLSRTPSAKDALSDLELTYNGTIACPECKGFRASDYKAPRTPYQQAMRDGLRVAPSDMRLARHRPEIAARFKAIIKACRDDGTIKLSASSIIRTAHNLKKIAIRVLDPLAPAPTITSMPDDLLHYSEPRTLTVRENARLQSFPDWFEFKGKYTTGGHMRAREVPRFTQVANAIPPLLAEQLGLGLFRLLGRNPFNIGVKSETSLR